MTEDNNEPGPFADRMDLPEHERKLSAKSYAMLLEGEEDIRAGRIVRSVELAEFEDRKWGPSLLEKCWRIYQILLKHLGIGKK